MAVTVELRKPGANGKVYLLHPRPERERWRLIRLVHQLRCQDDLSYRAIQRRLAELGVYLSLGRVHDYSRDYVCKICRDDG